MKLFKNFISFEGIDFSGKSTQIKLLLEKLREHNIKAMVLREPGGTIISEKIRAILLDKSYKEMNPKTEILLYSAARTQLVHEKIIPELEKGAYIIVDRFYDSTTAYQGFGRVLDLSFVNSLNLFATSQLKPYKTFFIDITPKEAEKRRKAAMFETDRIENEGVDFYKQIRDGFLKMVKNEPERFICIDGEQPPSIIADHLWENICYIWDLH
jgi:dTMP kinase